MVTIKVAIETYTTNQIAIIIEGRITINMLKEF